MKTRSLLFSPVIILIFSVILVSCMHKAEIVLEPVYPGTGTWQGTTWQNRPITLSVGHVDTGLFITLYDFYVKNDASTGPDSILHLTRSSVNGMAPVVGSQFYVPIANVNADYESVSGKFDSTATTVSGHIAVIFKTEGDTVKGTFTAAKKVEKK
jgi:hypothetical protein